MGGGRSPGHDGDAVLGIAPFRRLWSALGLWSVAGWLGLLATVATARGLASGAHGGSYAAQNLAIAGAFLALLLPGLVAGEPAAALADRLGSRWALVLGGVLSAGLLASVPFVGGLGPLYVVALLIGCVSLLREPATDAAVPRLVPERRLDQARRLVLVAVLGGAPLAALAAAALSVTCDAINRLAPVRVIDPVVAVLWLAVAGFLGSSAVAWRLVLPPGPARPATPAGAVRPIVRGWRFLGPARTVRALLAGLLGAVAAVGLLVGTSLTLVTDLGAGQPGFALLLGSLSAGTAVGWWGAAHLLGGFSRRRLFGLSIVLAGCGLVLLAAVPHVVAATLLSAVAGAGAGAAWGTGSTLLGLEVDDDVRDRTFAFLRSSARAVLVPALAAGPALAALIGTHRLRLTDDVAFTYNGAAWVLLLAGVLAVVVGRWSFRRLDDRVGTPVVAELRRAWGAAPDDLATGPGHRAHPGVFIAFEGGDGAGKSTQARELAEWLHHDLGHDVVLTREPGATPVGAQLRALLLGHGTDVGPRAEALLFAADRAHHVEAVVRPALCRGDIVITDRYSDSSVAYQGAGRDLDADDVARLSLWATDALRPDLTVLLDLPIEIQRVRRSADAGRARDDRLESLPKDFHERVRARFLELAARDPRRYLVLDASEPRDQLQAAIRRRVRDLAPISSRRRAELAARLAAEEDQRRRRAAAEAEVLKLDANLRGRNRDEAVARQLALRAAHDEAVRAVREERDHPTSERTAD